MPPEKDDRQGFAEVAVDAPVGHDRTFSYSIPPSIQVCAGQLVTVPFGPRRVQGVVVSLAERAEVPETRDILATTESVPPLTDAQLRLARWISSYYVCSLFEAIALMLPPGGRRRFKTYLSMDPAPSPTETASLSDYQERVLDHVRRKGRVEEGRLLDALGRPARAALDRLIGYGLVVRSHTRAGSTVGPRLRQLVSLAPGPAGAAEEALAGMARRAPRRAALLGRLLREGDSLALSEARKEYGPSAVKGLLDKGLLQTRTVALDRDPLAGRDFPPSRPVALTPTQRRVASEVRKAFGLPPDSARAFLIEGVTGSGKTEIYLDAVHHCLKLGKRAIVLVPEIALTHQTVERFASRFPREVAVLHSGLTTGERFDQWWKVRQGRYGVVIGSRSAIFAPVPDLGLIVIDEEHEWTYKQHDASPRYHDRLVALRLAELSGAVVVLGSATPDVESYHRAQGGGLRLMRLPERVVPSGSRTTRVMAGSRLASVQVVDMRRELREGNRSIFSRALLTAMSACLEADTQALLFLNRRGSSTLAQCRSCGLALSCRRCDIAMTYHGDIRRMLCHYCGERRIPPDKCPRCLTYRIAYKGTGTQAVEEEISRRFPGARTVRWDRDSARSPREQEALLERFASGAAHILVGTQMIAKGLHFPSVTLVGAVLADVGLGVPDFRAGERAFQVLCQVAGRSGRGETQGTAIIQTYQPDNYAIKAAATQDYGRFYREEIAHRREQGNPPFGRLIRLVYAHVNNALCEREALRLSGVMRRERESWGYSDIEILGPTPAYPARLRGRYRWQLVLRGASPRMLLDTTTIPPDWVVDVDPMGPG